MSVPMMLVALFSGVVLLFILLRLFVEPLYILIYNRPMFLYWYPIPKKLSHKQKIILEREFSFYRRLDNRRKSYFEHRVKSFLIHYKFVGKEMAITDEVKILTAGTYVMLTFGFRNYLVPLFSKIIFYPTPYYSTLNEQYHKGEFNPRMKAVVFSWEDFVSGHQTANNVNLGLHEFSHALHFHAIKSNDPSASIFYDEFNQVANYFHDAGLNNQLYEKNYFRDYAYENQFEFLAVLLEHFFETPQVFKAEFPDLFERVRSMVNIDEKLLH